MCGPCWMCFCLWMCCALSLPCTRAAYSYWPRVLGRISVSAATIPLRLMLTECMGACLVTCLPTVTAAEGATSGPDTSIFVDPAMQVPCIINVALTVHVLPSMQIDLLKTD